MTVMENANDIQLIGVNFLRILEKRAFRIYNIMNEGEVRKRCI